ncbi:MAG: hypothetical protein RQ741_11675 [Wenzhouxiangellaceae bacterium]|nr:hypothetical protein [Wenzhouxiangellaceae bacterium]
MLDAPSRLRLQKMGIELWSSRSSSAATAPASIPDAPSQPRPALAAPRIRLGAGSGPWLLIIDEASAGRERLLLEDIRATIGAAQCRFGQWSDSPDSGVGADDWLDHGIKHVLVLGGPAVVHRCVINAPALADLAGSADLRRQLWLQMKKAMGA